MISCFLLKSKSISRRSDALSLVVQNVGYLRVDEVDRALKVVLSTCLLTTKVIPINKNIKTARMLSRIYAPSLPHEGQMQTEGQQVLSLEAEQFVEKCPQTSAPSITCHFLTLFFLFSG